MLGRVIQKHFNFENEDLLTVAGTKGLYPGFNGLAYIHDDAAHWKKPEELEVRKDHYRYKKVIFMARDPRDVIVSIYFEKSKRLKAYLEGEKLEYPSMASRIKPYDGDLSSYLKEPVGGFDTILKFYNIWERNRKVAGDFLLLRYENIKRDPVGELRRVLDFIGMDDVTDDLVNDAVDFSSFEKMRAMESEDKFKSDKLRPAIKGDPDSFKTRKGKVGGYVNYLSDQEIVDLSERMARNLSTYFGYQV